MVDALSNAAIEELRKNGHDVQTVLGVWKKDPGNDKVILDYAVQENRTVITCDKDFGTMVFRDKVSSRGVILYDQMDNQKVAGLIIDVVKRHEAEQKPEPADPTKPAAQKQAEAPATRDQKADAFAAALAAEKARLLQPRKDMLERQRANQKGRGGRGD
jgi:predicted nuclease of predicted toxin-antitoxin system